MTLNANYMEQMSLGERLKQLYTALNFKSGRQFAISLGIDPSQFSKIENGKLRLSFDNFKDIVAKHNVNPAWLLDGEGEMFKSETFTDKLRNDKLAQTNKIPFYDAQAAAGNEGADTSPVTTPSGSIDVGDLLRDSEAAIRIYGNSMIPNYPPGCVVGLIRQTSSDIEPGEVYVIETANGRKLKRLFYKDDDPESDTFVLYSDNTLKFEGGSRHGKLAYPVSHLKKSEVIRLYAVTGVIKRNSNSAIIQRD